ncbi:MAG: thiamine phosphate synthase [Opitutae bacterium]|nr:thiamine phosphate synthase [Opitutae bacterium]
MTDLPSVILISPPSEKDGEIDLLCQFFDAGLSRFHLRKPNFSAEDLKRYLNQIPSEHLSKIVVHRCPEVLADFAVGGYHLRSNESAHQVLKGTSSKSLHKLSELTRLKETMDYVFLGPIFRSVSKQGYGPKISLNEIFSLFSSGRLNSLAKIPKVYALGGIRKKKMLRLSEVGFSGVALLGSVWGSRDPLKSIKDFLALGVSFSSGK